MSGFRASALAVSLCANILGCYELPPIAADASTNPDAEDQVLINGHDPQVVLEAGIPPCETGWSTPALEHPLEAQQKYSHRCVIGEWETDLDPHAGEPTLPDGCQPDRLVTEYQNPYGEAIARVSMHQRYGFSAEAYSQVTKEIVMSVSDWPPTWLWYSYQDGDVAREVHDNPEDGLLPQNPEIFFDLRGSGLPADQKNDEDTSTGEYSRCTVGITQILEPDAELPLVPEFSGDPSCAYKITARSLDGTQAFEGLYYPDINAEEPYSWTYEVKDEDGQRVLFKDVRGRDRVQYADTYAYDQFGDRTLWRRDYDGGGSIDYEETREYTRSAEGKRVDIFGAYPSVGQIARLYLVLTYDGQNLVRQEGYRSHVPTDGEYDARSPVLNGLWSHKTVWLYEADYDVADHKTREAVYAGLEYIEAKTPSELRLTEYDTRGRITHTQYIVEDDLYLLERPATSLMYDAPHSFAFDGWNEYAQWNDEDQLILVSYDKPPGQASRWKTWQYDCDP